MLPGVAELRYEGQLLKLYSVLIIAFQFELFIPQVSNACYLCAWGSRLWPTPVVRRVLESRDAQDSESPPNSYGPSSLESSLCQSPLSLWFSGGRCRPVQSIGRPQVVPICICSGKLQLGWAAMADPMATARSLRRLSPNSTAPIGISSRYQASSGFLASWINPISFTAIDMRCW